MYVRNVVYCVLCIVFNEDVHVDVEVDAYINAYRDGDADVDIDGDVDGGGHVLGDDNEDGSHDEGIDRYGDGS